MGKFIDSFKREVGKNTGKWVSNKLFGDKHATPIKIIRKREDDPHAVQHAVERALKNCDSTPYSPTPSKNDALDSLATNYKQTFNRLYSTNHATTPTHKDSLKEIEFDLDDEKGIIIQLYRIQAFFETGGWKSGNNYNAERNNSESDWLLSKMHEGCKMLEIANPAAPQLPQFQLFLHKLHKKRWRQRYGPLIYSFGSMLLVIILSLIMMYIED